MILDNSDSDNNKQSQGEEGNSSADETPKLSKKDKMAELQQ